MTKEFFTNQLCRFEGPVTQMLSLVPEDKLAWSPAPNTMPAHGLAQHICTIVTDHADSMVSGQWTPKAADAEAGKGKTKQQLIQDVRTAFERARNTMEKISQHEFETKRSKIEAGAISMEGTIEELAVSLVLIHVANHTMQLFWYLRQAGVDADTGTLYFGMPPGQFSTRPEHMGASA